MVSLTTTCQKNNFLHESCYEFYYHLICLSLSLSSSNQDNINTFVISQMTKSIHTKYQYKKNFKYVSYSTTLQKFYLVNLQAIKLEGKHNPIRFTDSKSSINSDIYYVILETILEKHYPKNIQSLDNKLVIIIPYQSHKYFDVHCYRVFVLDVSLEVPL